MNQFLRENKSLLWSLLILAFCYLPLLYNLAPFDPDKPFIIDIWKGVFSIQSYELMKHNILDVQPIRDLYFWILVNFLPKSFVPLNAIIWVGSIFIFSNIFNNEEFDKRMAFLLVSLGLHPVAIWCIMWPSAAKHLLSLFFILLSLYHCFNFKDGLHLKNKSLTIIFYFLSLFTQPLFLLYPLFILYQLRKRILQNKGFLLSLFSIFVIGGGVNWYYYEFIYPTQTGVPKTLQFSEFSLAMNLLGISRSITQVFFPIKMAFFYSPTSPINMVGIPLIVLLALYSYLKGQFKAFIKIGFFFLPLGLIYIKATNIFVSDTYLLLPLFSLFPLLTSLKMKPLVFVYSVFLILLGAREIYTLSNDGNKLKVSYTREPNCKNSLLLSGQHLYKVQINEFKKTISESMKNNCLLSGVNATTVIMDLYSANVFFDQTLKREKKVELLKNNKIQTPLIELIKDKLNSELKESYDEAKEQKKLFSYIRDLKLSE